MSWIRSNFSRVSAVMICLLRHAIQIFAFNHPVVWYSRSWIHKVILLKWLGFYPSQSLLQITVSIFEGVQGRHCLRSGHPALWSDTSVWRGACWYTIHHCLSGIIRLSFKIRSCNETCRSFLFWNFRHKMTGKILHGECGPIVMASIDDLTG